MYVFIYLNFITNISLAYLVSLDTPFVALRFFAYNENWRFSSFLTLYILEKTINNNNIIGSPPRVASRGLFLYHASLGYRPRSPCPAGWFFTHAVLLCTINIVLAWFFIIQKKRGFSPLLLSVPEANALLFLLFIFFVLSASRVVLYCCLEWYASFLVP